VAKRDRLNVDNFFSEVDQNQEVYNLRERLQLLEQQLDQQVTREQSLVSEIEQLRSQPNSDSSSSNGQQLTTQLGQLRDHLKQNQGTVQFPLSKIQPNLDQPRKTFDEAVEAMALSLQQEGQLDPIILFEDGLLFDGECRWRAATHLGWETIDAVFTANPNDPKLIRRRAYLTSLHRRGLNALDKAETLVAIACDEIPDLPPEEVPRILNRVLTRLKRKNQSLGDRLHLQSPEQQQAFLDQLDLEPVEAQLFAIFLKLQEQPSSLARNIFPALNLSADLKTAVRGKALGCAQALLLNRLSAAALELTERQALKLREKGIKAALSGNFSTTQVQQWVSQQKLQHGADEENVGAIARDQQVDRLLSSVQKVDLRQSMASLDQLKELQKALETALMEVKQKIKQI
jgi:ParB family transcriptional regulator, chromosome partitioning protein